MKGPRRGSDDGAGGPSVAPDVPQNATMPNQIPWCGWMQLLRRAAGHAVVAHLPLLSAGIAFFAVLSIAPVLVTALSVYGAVNTPAQAVDQLSRVAEMLPPQMEPIVADQLTSITAASGTVLTVSGLTGLVLALATATTATMSLIDVLTVAYHEDETRGFLSRFVLAVTFVLAGVLTLGAVIAAVGVTSRALRAAPEPVRALAPVLVWLALAVLVSSLLAVLYRFAPDRKQARWRWINGGALGATTLWLAMSVALFAYVRSLGTYETTYGSLAGVAISMFWLWMTVVLVVLGAAVNGEAERQTDRDSTVGPEMPMGERGAVVADTLRPSRGDP